MLVSSQAPREKARGTTLGACQEDFGVVLRTLLFRQFAGVFATTAPADELGACGLLVLLEAVGCACDHGLGRGVGKVPQAAVGGGPSVFRAVLGWAGPGQRECICKGPPPPMFLTKLWAVLTQVWARGLFAAVPVGQTEAGQPQTLESQVCPLELPILKQKHFRQGLSCPSPTLPSPSTQVPVSASCPPPIALAPEKLGPPASLCTGPVYF